MQEEDGASSEKSQFSGQSESEEDSSISDAEDMVRDENSEKHSSKFRKNKRAGRLSTSSQKEKMDEDDGSSSLEIEADPLREDSQNALSVNMDSRKSKNRLRGRETLKFANQNQSRKTLSESANYEGSSSYIFKPQKAVELRVSENYLS